jgi:membrane-associated protease RseP (regulator of RpoE activity)
MNGNHLMVLGTGTADIFDRVVEEANREAGFSLVKMPASFGPSDQLAFVGRQVPVISFFAGLHRDYHQPSDDFERLNLAGMRRIALFASQVAASIADATPRPRYVGSDAPPGKSRPVFGCVPDLAYDGQGVALGTLTPGGPAERAGLKAGDVVVQFGGRPIAGTPEFAVELGKHHSGDLVKVQVQRGQQHLNFDVTLDPSK